MAKPKPAFYSRSEKGNRLHQDSIHRWYRFVLAFPDHLVTELLGRLGIGIGQKVLDPFCGTGTTLIECKKRSIESFGMDSNPAAVFASKVKTTWKISSREWGEGIQGLESKLRKQFGSEPVAASPLFTTHSAGRSVEDLERELKGSREIFRYLRNSGMIARGWIQEIPLLHCLLIQDEIAQLKTARPEIKNLLLLNLIACVIEDIADIKFGPELYCVKAREQIDVLSAYRRRLRKVQEDISSITPEQAETTSEVWEGDAREVGQTWRHHQPGRVDAVITSPPYPTEHDYTRNTRLELAFLGAVHDRKSLQAIKKRMIRSHSKGIYADDSDGRLVRDIPEIMGIVGELQEKASHKTYGFAKMYPRIIEEYFGGMLRHLESLYPIMRPGGRAAYVVGEQRCYLNTYTPTATLLGMLAEKAGFRVTAIETWRNRVGTTGSGEAIKEEVLYFAKSAHSKKKSS